MIAAAVSKNFGVIAADSAWYEAGKMSYEKGKLMFVRGKYLATYIGSPMFLAKIDWGRFTQDLGAVSIYLKEYLQKTKPEVEKTLKDLQSEEEARICVFVLGVYNGKPTLAQFNSFHDFKPKYLFSDGGPKFASIYYGDDTKKNEIFKESTEYMQKRVFKMEKKGVDITPGLLGEVLTRGIYKKADLEQEAYGKKYAGGVVSTAVMYANGQAFGLSNVLV